MGQGINKTQRIDIIDSFDPRTTGLASQKGTTFRYIPASGDPELLIKDDDGFSTNWSAIGGSAPSPITIVVAASTGDTDVSLAPADLDGVTLVEDDLVLIKDQISGAESENGVYRFVAAGEAMPRAAGWDTSADFTPGKQVFVDGGDTQADTLWANTNYVEEVGVTDIIFINVSASAGMATDFANATASAIQLNLGSHKIINVTDPTGDQDAATKKYVDDNAMATDFSNAIAAANDVDLGTHKIVALATPTNPTDAATKAYVDAASPTGTVNTLGYFNGAGALSSNAKLSYDGNNIGLVVQTAGGATTYTRGGIGALAVVQSANAAGTAAVTINGNGAFIHGCLAVNGSDFVANGAGSFAHGYVSGTGTITANGDGSEAFGRTASGTISAGNGGARASGYIDTNGTISATNLGSFAHGYIDTNGTITATSGGAFAQGTAINGAITANGQGAFAHGYCDGAGANIQTSAFGATAFGYVGSNGGNIQATAQGAVACGYIFTPGGEITASGKGSFASGGNTIGGDDLIVSGDFAQGFGRGHANDSYCCMIVGQYATTGFTAAAVVATDPGFMVGNGTGPGARSSSFRIDKDARLTSAGSQVRTAIRIIAAAAVVSARTDYRILCNLAGATGAVTLPPGEDGLEFVIGPKGAGAAVYTITPNGAETLDPSVVAAVQTGTIAVRLVFLTGVWYNG